MVKIEEEVRRACNLISAFSFCWYAGGTCVRKMYPASFLSSSTARIDMDVSDFLTDNFDASEDIQCHRSNGVKHFVVFS